MDRETRSWMVGVGFESDGAPVRVQTVTLSRDQKWELAGFTGLVMASTVFFLTPLVLSTPEPSLEMAPLERTAVPLVVPVATPASVPAPAPAAVLSVDGSRAAAPRAQGGSRMRSAAVISSSRPFVSTVALTTPVNAARKATAPAKRKGVPNGLMRVLVGSGRYRVQPFPSPTSD